MVLGGDYAVYDGTRRGKEWEQFKIDYAGRFIVTQAEADECIPIRNAVLQNPLAMSYLSGEHEKVIHWKIGPRKCMSTLDNIGKGIISDLKITNCTEPSLFSWQAEKMAWHAQLAFYQQAAGNRDHDLALVGVEPKPPYNVTVLTLSDAAEKAGDDLCRQWFEKLIECEASGKFPGYTDKPFEMTLKGTKTIQLEEEAE